MHYLLRRPTNTRYPLRNKRKLPFPEVKTNRFKLCLMPHCLFNVPIDIDKSVNPLPRTFLQSQTIQLQLFRKLSFSKPYLYETIRPNLVLEAAPYLSDTEFFKLEKVVVSEDMVNTVSRTATVNANFIVNPKDEPCDTIIDQEEQDFVTVPGIEDLFEKLEELLKEIDVWDETKDDLTINPVSLDTLLLSNENLLMKLDPGEGRKPLYLKKDHCLLSHSINIHMIQYSKALFQRKQFFCVCVWP